MKILKVSQYLQTAAIAGTVLLSGVGHADDTDVYTKSKNTVSSAPMVMFSLDYRSNLGSTICTAGAVQETYAAVKDLAPDSTVANDTFKCSAAAFLARNPFTKADIEALASGGKKLDFFDIIRGAMKIVLTEVSGVRVGLMMNHKHSNNCAGPDAVDTPDNQKAVDGCSNGGFIPLGFTFIGDLPAGPDSIDSSRAKFFSTLAKLDALSEGEFVDSGTANLIPDTDGDGIDDLKDKCPKLVGAAGALTGCPKGDTGDEDDDGNLNNADNCPVFPEVDGANGDRNDDGCPKNQDGDADGIKDEDDACPELPEDEKGDNAQARDGCPLYTDSATTGANGNTAEDHTYQGKELFFEFFRYLTGQGIYNARNGWLDFYKDSDDYNLLYESDVDNRKPPAVKWDSSIEKLPEGASNPKKSVYISPLAADQLCSKIFTINIMFQVSQQEDDSDAAIKASKVEGGMGGINLTGPNNNFATVIEYLNDVDLADGSFGNVPNIPGKQNVESFFIVSEKQINTTTTSYAQAGDTGQPLPLSEDPEVLVRILSDIFRQVLSVSTTFVAASIPVNVFNRAETEDELFLALFEASEDPFWNGNVKKLKIKSDGTSRTIVDVNGAQAIGSDGRIEFSALTPWTKTGIGNAYLPAGQNANDNILEGADGRHVNRGGAGQQIPGFLPDGRAIGDSNATGDRVVFTDAGLTPPTSGTAISLNPLDVDTDKKSDVYLSIYDMINKANAGKPIHALLPGYTYGLVEDANAFIFQFCKYVNAALSIDNVTACETEADKMVRYMRGQDVNNEDNDATTPTTNARPWLFGDPLHSKPSPMNYGAFADPVLNQTYTTDSPAIYVAVASNDGGIRMIRNTLPGGVEDGQELWSFIPESTLKTQRILSTPTGQPPHPYGVDGNPVSIFDTAGATVDASTDTVSMVIGQRRGGKHYYALDVTNPYTPKLKWRIPDTATRSSTPVEDFSKLGFTFSTPQKAVLEDGTSALIFGGGYDLNKDVTHPGTDDSVGTALFIVNAQTGQLIRALTHPKLVDSIPSDVTVADTGLIRGRADRVIFGDTGGNIWRADLGGPEADWELTLLATLGRHSSGADTTDRRFFHAPDLVRFRDDTGAYDAIIITSGDRADPLDLGWSSGSEPVNQAFMLKDRNVNVGSAAGLKVTESGGVLTYAPLEIEDLGDVSNNCLDAKDTSTCSDTLSLQYGWRFALNGRTGEKGLAVPFTFGGVVFFTTFLPASVEGSGDDEFVCGPAEGDGRLYAVNLEDATPAYDYNKSEDSEKDRYSDLASGGIPAEVVFIPPGQILKPDLSFEDLKSANRFRTYWQYHEGL